jgi:peptidoglycan/LPS O-acetylase OafA/YrhL
LSRAQILTLPDAKPAAPGILNARRGDIQGLRALAVMAVIFYHLRIPGFSGGFVGVDAFFVISGFLVTGILFREIDLTGRIMILPFLARRCRRLLPNAALTLFVALLATMLFLPRYRLDAVVGDLVSAALFYSNVHFAALTVDYFALDMPPSPVLHFWSLSIEGQFYLLLPVFLFLICKLFSEKKRTAATAMALVILMSFGASLAIADSDQTKAFFSIWARCWQFALGGLINVARLPAGRKIGTAISALGIAGLIACMAVLDDTLAYPGFYALLPTFSAALVIWGGSGGGAVSRLLSQPAMQAIGDRSYSLYLWHWPIILIVGEQLFKGHRWALLPLTFVVAEIAYRYVEIPLRFSRGAAPNAVYVIAAGAALQCLVAAAGLGVVRLPLMTSAADARIAELISSAVADKGRNYDLGCHLASEAADIPENCAFGDVGGAKTVVLFGDSHAAQWFEPLEAAASKHGWKLLAWTKSSCPSADVAIYFIPKKTEFPECDLWRQRVMSRLRAEKPALVVLANNNAYSGWINDRNTGARLYKSNALDALRQGLHSVVFQLAEAGVHTTVIADTPRAFSDYRDCISRNGGVACERQREDAIAEPKLELDALAGLQGVNIENFNDKICGLDTCPLFNGGNLIYRDSDHLAATYTQSFEPKFADMLLRAK